MCAIELARSLSEKSDHLILTTHHRVSICRCIRQWNAHDKFGPQPIALARRRDLTAVHGHQPADQRQPDSQAPLSSIQTAVNLRKHVEDIRQHRRRDPNPGVSNGNHGIVLFLPCTEPDPAPSGVYFAALFNKFEIT